MEKEKLFIPYQGQNFTPEQSEDRTRALLDFMNQRRSVRDISEKPVSKEVIENLIQIASTSPSGAHKQPWTFVAISNPIIKEQIRKRAEEEEYYFYHEKASDEWKKDLEPLGTDWNKPFLTKAPWLIVVFRKIYNESPDGRTKNYYVNESVGISCGFLLQAIHNAGLVSLTHTPSPMDFLTEILERPSNERPFLLIPVGYPEDGAKVPNLKRKALSEVSVFME